MTARYARGLLRRIQLRLGIKSIALRPTEIFQRIDELVAIEKRLKQLPEESNQTLRERGFFQTKD